MPRPINIPETVWLDQDYFNSDITPLAQELYQISSDELLTKIVSMNKELYQQCEQERCCCWLAIAFGHSDISAEMLLIYAGMFRLSTESLLSLAATFGNQPFVEAMIKDSHTSINRMVKTGGIDYALGKAIRHNNLNILSRLESLIPNEVSLIQPGRNGLFSGSDGEKKPTAGAGSSPYQL